MKCKNCLESKYSIFFMLCLCLLTAICFDQSKTVGIINGSRLVTSLIIMIPLSLFFLVIWLKKMKMLNDEQIICLLFVAGFLLRLSYVIFQDVHTEQNDAGSFEAQVGHLGYISYLCSYMHLPDFDPRERYQFYHPPLHHIISAIFMKINLLLGYSTERTKENLQVLPLFYSTCMMICVDSIMKKLMGSKWIRLIAMSIIAFFPYFILLSGSINNDCLVTLLMLMCINETIEWYHNPSYKNIAKIAILIGLAMMTKMSATLLTPGIAFVFLCVFIKNKKNYVNFLRQFGLFICISFPLGLWFPIRNLLKYRMLPNFIPMISTESSQYIGQKYSRWNRLVDFSPVQFHHLTIAWNNAEAYCEHNIFLALVKFSAFGEENVSIPFYLANSFIHFVAALMFWLLLVSVVFGIVFFIYWFINGKEEIWIRLFFLITSIFILANYIRFCFLYPHVCTMNVRYVLIPVLLFIIGSQMGINQYIENKTTKNQRYIKCVIGVWSTIFCLTSFIMTVLRFVA